MTSAEGQCTQSNATRMVTSTTTQASLLGAATPPKNKTVTGREMAAAAMASVRHQVP